MILALDLATVTGVACGHPRAAPVAWSFKLTGAHPERFGTLARTVNRLIKERRPARIVLEEPFVGKHPDVARLLYGLRGVVLGISSLHGVPTSEHKVAEIRKHFLGHSGGKRRDAKPLVIERCRTLGWLAKDDNEADALALWSFAASKADPEHSRATMRIFDGAGMD